MTETQPLHLPDLYIEGFLGIDQLSIPRLGRVTLLTGKNGVGKSTVLDAIRVYAARGRYPVLRELLEGRDEFSVGIDDDGETVLSPDIDALFYGWNALRNGCVKIGPTKDNVQLRIEIASPNDVWDLIQSGSPSGFWDIDAIQAVKVTFQGSTQIISWSLLPRVRNPQRRRSDDQKMHPTVKCESLGPGVLSNQDLARFWDNVVLANNDESAMEPLRFIFGKAIEGVVVVGDNTSKFASPSRRGGRRVMVKLNDYNSPVPLRSLGDGAARILGVSMAFTSSQNGFLLIDEVENGLHHSLQHDFWRMVLQTAQANNVQVLATTHSWDCVSSFARAAIECEEAEGILYRLSRRYGDLRAVEYPEDELKIAADQQIEVR